MTFSIFVAWIVCLSFPYWCPRVAAWITRGQTQREESWSSPELAACRRMNERVNDTKGRLG